MFHSMNRYMILMLLLALPSAGNAAQACHSESEIPASTPNGQFVDHGNGTVTDEKIDLMWAKCAAGLSGSGCASGNATTHTWREALVLAEASNLAGHGDWRLPNIKELRSIVEEQCSAPAINMSVFPYTAASDFWSASPLAAASSYGAWYVYFGYGYSDYGYFNRGDYKHVRLVRGGQ